MRDTDHGATGATGGGARHTGRGVGDAAVGAAGDAAGDGGPAGAGEAAVNAAVEGAGDAALGAALGAAVGAVGDAPAVPRERLTLGRFCRDVVDAGGDAEAIVTIDRRLTYAGLGAEVRAAARALVAAGVAKGERVALCMGNGPELAVALLAAGSIGAVAVPVSTFATADERHHVLRHSDASVLWCTVGIAGRRFVDDLVAVAPELGRGPAGRLLAPSLPALRRVVVDDRGGGVALPAGADRWADVRQAGEAVPDAVVDALVAEVDPDDDALVIYTSGTTAAPKAVLHRQRAPVHQAWVFADFLKVEPGERVWSNLPMFWSAGMAMVLYATLAGGATVVAQERFEAGETLRLLEQERVTTAHVPVHVATALAEHPDFARRDLSSLRRIAARNPLRAALGLAGDTWDPAGAYGQTETFAQVTSVPADAPPEVRHHTHGVPLPGAEIRIVDPATGAPVPTGEPGEIAVRGVSLMRGYYKADVQPFDEHGFLRTGDAGRLDEHGHLHWDGRLTRMIRSAGANVSPAEVEDRLHRTGRVELSLVLGVPHPTLGEAVVACVAPIEGDPVGEDDLIDLLRPRLSSYKLPRRVLFLPLAAFPLTGTDKVRADVLADRVVDLLVADPATDASWRAHLAEGRGGAVAPA